MAFRGYTGTHSDASAYSASAPSYTASHATATMDAPAAPSHSSRKRQRTASDVPPPVGDNAFIQDQDAGESGGDDDDDDDKPKDKKAGRRKIKIEFIQDKSRRHITFSKRKAGASIPFPPLGARARTCRAHVCSLTRL